MDLNSVNKIRKNRAAILFLFLLISISVYYNYHKIFFLRPQSVHKWRQSDCASIALNYYQNGLNFFHIETHNLTSESGKSGKCCTSEVPILYYSVALLYKLFGYHEYIYRIFNTLLFYLGLFYLFLLLYYLLNDWFWAASISILFFTSPVLVYYGNNFLSNSTAFSFTLISWYYFTRFWFERRPWFFYVSMIIILVSGALKVTALFSFFAFAGIFLIEYLKIASLNKDVRLFNQPIPYATSMGIIILILGAWLVYAHIFNEKHDCTYFSTTIFPIWQLSKPDMILVFKNVRKLWLSQYFHPSVLIFLLTCLFFTLYNFKKNLKLFSLAILFLLTEIIVYVTLQFWTFADHDYYTIDIYILPVIIIISTFYILKENAGILSSVLFKILFAVFVLFNVYYAKQKLQERYQGWMNDYVQYLDIYAITPYLRQIGINTNDTVISIPDKSNATLYLMNQKGWTEYTDARFNRGKFIKYNQDSSDIQQSIERGARYLIVNGIEELLKKPYLLPFTNHLKSVYKNVLIFDLKNDTINFNFTKPLVDNVLFCDAEHLSSDGQYYLDIQGKVYFQNGNTRSNERVFNGQFSCKLYESAPYGMTCRFDSLKNGDLYVISVFKKSMKKDLGTIVASSVNSNVFYRSDYKVDSILADGWEKISLKLVIPFEQSGQNMVVYLFNPEKEPVYFDNLTITKYKNLLNTIHSE